jgi:hypothetical protein
LPFDSKTWWLNTTIITYFCLQIFNFGKPQPGVFSVLQPELPTADENAQVDLE